MHLGLVLCPIGFTHLDFKLIVTNVAVALPQTVTSFSSSVTSQFFSASKFKSKDELQEGVAMVVMIMMIIVNFFDMLNVGANLPLCY